MRGSSRRGRSQPSRNGRPRHRAGAAAKKTKHPARSVGSTPRAELLSRFGARVCACRNAAQLTQDELAVAAFMRQPYVAAIKAGVINPTLATMANIARALGVATGDLV